MAARQIGEAFITISGRTAKFTASLKTVQRKLTTFTQRMGAKMRSIGKSLSRGLDKALPKLTAFTTKAAIGLAVMTAALGVASRAAAVQEAAEAKVAASLRLVGDASRASAQSVFAMASALQSVTTVGDEALLPIVALGANLSKLGAKDMKVLTVAAIGLAQVIGKDVQTAMTLLARAVQGQFDLFSRYGIAIDATATEQEKLDSVMRASVAGFALARAEATTTMGKFESFKNVIGDALEKVGKAILTFVDRAFGLGEMQAFIIGLTEKMNTGFLNTTTATIAQVIVIGALAVVFIKLAVGIAKAVKALVVFVIALNAWNPVTLIAVLAGITAAILASEFAYRKLTEGIQDITEVGREELRQQRERAKVLEEVARNASIAVAADNQQTDALKKQARAAREAADAQKALVAALKAKIRQEEAARAGLAQGAEGRIQRGIALDADLAGARGDKREEKRLRLVLSNRQRQNRIVGDARKALGQIAQLRAAAIERDPHGAGAAVAKFQLGREADAVRGQRDRQLGKLSQLFREKREDIFAEKRGFRLPVAGGVVRERIQVDMRPRGGLGRDGAGRKKDGRVQDKQLNELQKINRNLQNFSIVG